MTRHLIFVLLFGFLLHDAVGFGDRRLTQAGPVKCPGAADPSCNAFAFLEIFVTAGNCNGQAGADCTAVSSSQSKFKEAYDEWWGEGGDACDGGKVEVAATAVATAIAEVWANAASKVTCDGRGFACGWSIADGNTYALGFAEALAQAAADAADGDFATAFCYADIRAVSVAIAEAAAKAQSDVCVTNTGTQEDYQNSYVLALKAAVADAFATATARACNKGDEVIAESECKGDATATTDEFITKAGDTCAGVAQLTMCAGSGNSMCCAQDFNKNLCRCEGCDGPWVRKSSPGDSKVIYEDKSKRLCFCLDKEDTGSTPVETASVPEEPEAGGDEEPETTPEEPEAGGDEEPQTTPEEPEAGGDEEPETTPEEPEAGGDEEPETTPEEPEAGGDEEPETTPEEPEAGGDEEPETTPEEPEAGGEEQPKTTPEEPETTPEEPEAGGDEEPEAGGEEQPETTPEEPEAGGEEQPETTPEEPETTPEEPEAGGEEQPETTPGEPETTPEEPEAGGEEQPETTPGEPETTPEEPEAGGEEEPETTPEEPETTPEEPPAKPDCPGAVDTSCNAFATLEILVTSGGSCSGRAGASCQAVTESQSEFKEAYDEWWGDSGVCDKGRAEAAASAMAKAIAKVWADAAVQVQCDGVGFACGWAASGGEAWSIGFAEAMAQAAAEAGAGTNAQGFCYADIRAVAVVIAEAAAQAQEDACSNGEPVEKFESNYAAAIEVGIANAFAQATAEACDAVGSVKASSKCVGDAASLTEGDAFSTDDACAGIRQITACTGPGKDMCCDKSFRRNLCLCQRKKCENGPWTKKSDFDETSNTKRSFEDRKKNVCFCLD